MTHVYIYYKNIRGEMFYIAVYVDDIILGGKTDEIKVVLLKKFEIKDLGELLLNSGHQNPVLTGSSTH